MKNNKIRFKNLIFYFRSRIHLIVFLLSVVALIFILFKIINLNVILGISTIIILDFFFQTLVMLSAIYTILFLPTYPIFFIIFKGKKFNFLEKLSITIIVNSVFYILVGYIGYIIGIPLTALFFFYTLIGFYFCLIIYIIVNEFKNGSYFFLKSNKSFSINDNISKDFSLINCLRRIIPLNAILLIFFIFLICIFNIVKVSYFPGTDPWIHILNSKKITDLNILPLDGYHGELGLHIFGAVIHFFSGFSHILLPKFFVFYTFFVSALIFYNLSMRIFRNQNLALFGVFILEFSSLGFSSMMLQYWPSGSALIKCLMIFFLLFVRLQNFIQLERPSNKQIYSNIIFTYALITLIFIGAALTHMITSLVFLLSFLWLYLIYFLKDYKRGFDLLLLCALGGVFLILNISGIGSGHFWFLIPFNLPLIYLAAVLGGGILAGGLLLWKMQKSIIFSKGRFKKVIIGKKNRYYRKFEDKIIIPLIFSCLIILAILFLIANLIWLNLAIINIFYIIEILMISAFAIWGLILFQKKPRGKPLFIWAMGLFLLLGAGFVFNIFILSNMIWQRILYLIPPVIVIGFVSYIYKLIKLHSINLTKIKIVIIFIIVSSLFTTYFYESIAFEVFTIKERDISTIKWYSNYTSNRNVIISEFGWSHAFKYFDFPFDDREAVLLYNGTDYFLKYDVDLFPPENHINESGVNILKEIKKEYNTDVYIIFADEYIINKGFELFGHLTKEQEEQYYSLDYLNKICSSRTKNGEETPIYWVI
ncbi:MAG: hypothetical protein ACFFA6_03430 [Promethearchaeota archaeon]